MEREGRGTTPWPSYFVLSHNRLPMNVHVTHVYNMAKEQKGEGRTPSTEASAGQAFNGPI